jgi:hypothetical protein
MGNKKSVSSELTVGSFLSETQYYKVEAMFRDKVTVVNERGFKFDISNGIIEEGCYSASQYSTTVELTRTELIEALSKVGDTVVTVNYHTQPKVEDINDAIESANKGKIIPIKELKKVVKEAYKGRERTLVGYLIKVETGFGRSMFIDLEADASKSTPDWDSRIRQVDHRTLNWFICKNTLYKQKK